MLASLWGAPVQKKKVGLCITATGRYIQFVAPLIRSARIYFCRDQEVTYFIFTEGDVPAAPDVVKIEQHRVGWPYDSMMRCEFYFSHRKRLEQMDYLFALDADMLFVGPVGNEILSDLVGTEHPCFVGKRGSYETNPKSSACVWPPEGRCYFAGGFWGGARAQFLSACETMSHNIMKDLHKGFIAIWHDESHLNRYFIDHRPTLVLSPSYCYPDNGHLPYMKRILCLTKRHDELRK
jgi:histo-blood group ABO system transferase